MKIAICDDDPLFQTKLKHLLEQTASNPELLIDCYSSGEQLLYKIKTCQLQYQLLLLDIEMRPVDGMQIARKLQQAHYEAQIVFVTSHEEFALEGYEVNAFRFLVKPVNGEKLRQTLSAVEHMQYQQKKLLIPAKDGEHIVQLQRIIYLEARNQDVVFYLDDGSQITQRENLSYYEKHLAADYFLRPHRGYLVNLRAIRLLLPQELHLINGTVLPVSRLRSKNFATAFHRYIQQTAR